ncbi:MAG: class I SAM-dependent methyltransferase, partial [Proteobacteria bacterium]|nr:class I SAM-dependent methyltransferase [Pseudomonadota bacterium]
MNQLFRYKDEIEINKALWERKGLLRKAYGDFYKKIKENLSSESGQILEIGSGIGAIKEIIPHCVLTDIVYTPYVNFVQSAYRLSIRDRCLSNIILFDVFHHLKFPLIALKEFSRVLKPKGRVIIFEPYISIFGYLVYGLMHKEPVGFNRKIIWNDKESDIKDNCYYSAQGNA